MSRRYVPEPLDLVPLDVWVARIDAVRERDGFDGSTVSTPVLAAFIVQSDRITCHHCDQPLSPAQRRKRQRHCSHDCAGSCCGPLGRTA